MGNLGILEIVILLLVAAGTFFTFLAGFGILRMPDVYTRMHASTKAASLGAGLMLVAAALYFQDAAVTTRVALTTIFIFLTAPVAAHMLGRSAYLMNVEQWKGSVMDEAKGKLDQGSHQSSSGEENAETDKTDLPQ